MCSSQDFDQFFFLAIINNTPRSRSSLGRRRSFLPSLVRNIHLGQGLMPILTFLLRTAMLCLPVARRASITALATSGMVGEHRDYAYRTE
jgi:hypothetical protein